MSQKNQSSSNDTNFTFGAAAAPAQAINDMPGSQESGGGGTMSYRAPGSIASTNSYTLVTQADAIPGGSARRSTSARSPRASRHRIADDGNSGRSPSGTATREDGDGRAATSSKRKPSTSASRNESEARLRRQLQHNNEKLEKSERVRAELENRLILYQDVLSHRDQMISNIEIHSNQLHEEYQQHVNSEMEFMRVSLIDAHHVLEEQTIALAEAHLLDEGSTMRIIELEKRGVLAEEGAAHIVRESMEMRGKYLTELENASQLIRQQHDTSEDMTEQFRHGGQQLREACERYVHDRETANKEEMERLKLKLSERSQMMANDNEMIMEYGQHAVAERDEQLAEMRSVIDELNANLAHKDNLIAYRDDANRNHIVQVRDMKNMIQEKEEEHKWKCNQLQVEIRSLMKANENESAAKEWYVDRFTTERNEFRQFKHDEMSAIKDREVTVERVKDEVMDENVALIESNHQLRTRINELLGAQFHAGLNEDNDKVIEELREELHNANEQIHRLQEAVESNPKLTEALIDAEEAEADRYKKLYQTACSERDHVIRKNDSLKLSLQDAKVTVNTMTSMPTSWNRAIARNIAPASSSSVPSTNPISRAAAKAGVTPSFVVPISTPMGTPKATNPMMNQSPSLPPPPSPGSNIAIGNKANSEIDDLRERLRRSEEQAQQNYEEMKEYQSWLEQAEEGQDSQKDAKAPELDPVPDNPPGLWDRKDGKDVSVANSDIGQDGKDWVTRISRKEHEKVTIKPWPKCQDLDVWRSNVVQSVCVASGDPDTAAWRTWLSPALLPEPDYANLADSGEFRFQSIDSKLSIALQNMVDAAGETASEVKIRIRQRSQVLGKEGNFLMDREILAMILDHFRTTSHDEVLFNASHIYKLQYRGDKEMDKFLNAWIEIIANMKVEDIPSDNTLRDHLLRKIDGSQALHVDLTIYKGRDNDDKKKTYQELLEIMRRHIARAREDRNIAARDKFATDYTNLGKPSTPAPKPTAPAPTPKDGKPGKPSAPAPKGKPGAPVLPSGNPKSHGKGKGKNGKNRSRSPSTRDPSKTFCHFHFNKGNCKHGDKCQYSHSQYHWDKRKDKGGKGKNGRSTSPRRSQTPGGKKERHCYGWLKGDCQKGDKCTFKHDPSMKGKRAAPSTKTSDVKATPALVREYDDDFIVKAVPIEKKNKMDVKFNDKVETIVYVKPDFVECSNRKPKRNMSRAQKKSLTCRTTKDIMDDPQWVIQSKLGMTRARAIGILMDDHGEFSDVDEVHVILGPKNDIKLKMNSMDILESNSRAEICYEEVIPHVPGQYGRRDNVMCITMPIELKDRRFIMDSGSGHDLISSTRVDRMDIDTYQSDRVNFHTANGITSTSTMVDLDFDTFNEPAKAHVLEDTPSVLSLGKRCMEQGYTFIWPSGRDPYMINSEGDKIKMEVHDHIPYVYLGAKDYRPMPDHEAEIVMKVLGLNGNNHVSRTIYLDGESGDEMSESDDGVGTFVDGPTKSPRKTKKKKRLKRRVTPTAVGEELDDDDDGYEASVRADDPEGDDVRVDEVPGADEDGEDDDDRVPAAEDDPEDGPPEEEVGVEHGPPEEEDDEDDIDVDDPDGGVRLSKRGTLKHEARTLEHLLTHRYKNPYCNSCVRAKMKHHKTYRGAFRRKLTKFGDLITFDFMDTRKTTKLGYDTVKEILVIRDRFTGIIQSYPSPTKNTEDVVRAVKFFMGRRTIREAYSDKARQFVKGMEALKIPFDHALPGRPSTNSLAERNNQFVIATTTTCLLEAGLPACFWKFAIRCVCHLLNVEPGEDDVSAWCKLHGAEFKGEKIPFGALVYFKPSGARANEQAHKFDPKGIPGVFAGYEIAPGVNWRRQYMAWALSDMTKQNYSFNAKTIIDKLRHPHLTEKIEVHLPLTFPCKDIYEKVNTTLEGLAVKDRLDGSPDFLEDQPDDDDEEGDDDDDGDGDDKPKKDKTTKRVGDQEEEFHRMVEELEIKLDKEKADDVEIVGEPPLPPPAGEPHYDGPEHHSMGKPGDGVIYLSDIGEHVKLDKRGRPYRVGPDGRKEVRGSPRPKDSYSPEEWRALSAKERDVIIRRGKLEEEAEKLKEIKLEKEKEKKAKAEISEKKKHESSSHKDPACEGSRKKKKKKKSGKDSKGSSGKDGGKDAAVNVGTLRGEWECLSASHDPMTGLNHKHGRNPWDRSSTTYGASDLASVEKINDTAPSAPSETSTNIPSDDDGQEFLNEWDEWSEHEVGNGPRAQWEDVNYDFHTGKVTAPAKAAPATPTSKDSNGKSKVDHIVSSVPCMPCVHQDLEHREKFGQTGVRFGKLFNAMVSRPVGRKEMMEDPDAKASMRNEWLGQHKQGVYDFSIIREYDDVVAEAKREGKEVHMARVHGICVEKNYQLPKGSPGRKFKGRGVLLGNQVKNQHWEAAFFQDLGNSPATFEASRWADFYGCLPGHNVKLADAIQAYIQARLTGPPCWVELPEDAWPDDVDIRKFRRPVVRLVKALYGHPDAGTMWEQHCDKFVREVGFLPVGEEWPSMYFHKELKLLLVIYVDDLKLAGPAQNLTKGWEMLRSKLRIEPETDLGLYLGCLLSKGTNRLSDGTEVTTMTYNMEGLLKLSVERYLELVGKDTKLKQVSTPSLPEETKQHKSRAPAPGDPKHAVQCPWCSTKFDPGSPVALPPGASDSRPESVEVQRGALAPHAASILMKLLYAARIARFDLLRSINTLARNVTKWSIQDDAKLYHLMCYVNSTLGKRMIGWVGNDMKDLSIALYADADFAGCAQSLRSTSGSHMHIQGKRTRFPLAGGSKRQGCVSHSTPEAEIVAADVTLRTMGLPALSIWETLTDSSPKLLFHDDNQGMIGVVRSGRNPTMRHLERTHGIAITSLHEHFNKDHFVLMYEITAKMAADIHTKGFTNPLAWKKACMLINLLDPEDLGSKQLADLVQPTTDVDTTVRQVFQSRTDEVPNFPYTETPILPPEVYRKGLSSREKLQELPGMDPIFVVKTPTLYRTRPAGVKLPADCLRSTWVLVHGKWDKVEDRVPPLLQQSRFDKWIERACFQYHSPTSAPIVSLPARASTAAGVQFLRAAALELDNHPYLTFSTEILFEQAQRPQKIPFSLYEGNPMTIRVINAMVRLVHGGRAMEDSKQPVPKTKPQSTPTRKRYGKKVASATECGHDEVPVRDEWRWIGDHVLERIHNIPRRQMFVPSDCEDCPCDHRLIQDWRETQLKFQSNVRMDRSNWRLPGNNGERSNNRNEFWTGKSIFRVLSHQGVRPVASCIMDDNLMICVDTMGLDIISPNKIFILHTYRMVIEENKNDNELNVFADSLINLLLVRDNGHCLKYTFVRSIPDLDSTKYLGKNVTITMQELPASIARKRTRYDIDVC